MYYRNQKLREIFMAWMTGGRRTKPGLVWSLKDRHTLKATSKRKDIPECGENASLNMDMRLKSVLQGGGFQMLESLRKLLGFR